jgi:anti-anti-sigma factor
MGAEFSIKKQKSGGFKLEINGELTVQNSRLFKESLLKLVKHEGQLSLSLAAIRAIDVSGVQLIMTMNNACKQTERKLQIEWPEDRGVSDLINKTGLKAILN